MGRLFRFFLVFLFLSSTTLSWADEGVDFSDEESLLEVLFEELPDVFGVSKKKESLKKVPMSVSVISNDEMNKWGIRQLYEVFQRVPGYSFYNTDYYGQYGPIGRGLQSIWRYGFSFELMNVVDFGHLTFSPHFFKNIEVARGPAGLMWGSGAEAGLLNFNIRDDLEGIEIISEIGNEGRQSYDILYGGKFNDEGDGFFVGWHYEEQDAVLQENAFDVPGQTWKMNGVAPSQTLIGKLKYKDFKFVFFQDHPKHVAPRIWFSDQGDALLSNLESVQDDEVGDNLEVVSYRLEYHLPLDKDNFNLYFYHDYYKKQWWFESLALDTQRKRSVGFNGEWSLFEERLNLNFGSNFWGKDQITAPSMTTTYARPYGITWYDSAFLEQDTEWSDAFGQAQYNLTDQVSVLVGGRWDYQKDAEDENLFTGPRVGFFYSPNDNLTFKYLFNSTNRRPQGNEASQGLSHEELEAHELIAIYELDGKFRVDLTLYSQELSDQITRQNVTESLNAFVNTGGLESQGLEWSMRYLPVENLALFWNGSYIDAEVNVGSLEGQEVAEPHTEDGSPLFVPEISSYLGIETSLGDLAKVTLAYRSQLNIPYITVNGNEDEADISFVDLSISSKKFFDNRFDVSFIALNLLDEDDRVPAFGEHAGNGSGTLQPEGARYYIRARLGY